MSRSWWPVTPEDTCDVVAIGHPLGMSGASIACSAALELVAQDANHAVDTICLGVGQGIAVSLEAA